jgi:hypothetical protein
MSFERKKIWKGGKENVKDKGEKTEEKGNTEVKKR